MFDLNPEKILLIGIIALMVLGPDRLPKAARSLAKGIQQIRNFSGSFQNEMHDVLAEPRQILNDAVSEIRLTTDRIGIPSIRGGLSQALLSPLEASSRSAGEGGADPGARVAGDDAGAALPDDPALN